MSVQIPPPGKQQILYRRLCICIDENPISLIIVQPHPRTTPKNNFSTDVSPYLYRWEPHILNHRTRHFNPILCFLEGRQALGTRKLVYEIEERVLVVDSNGQTSPHQIQYRFPNALHVMCIYKKTL